MFSYSTPQRIKVRGKLSRHFYARRRDHDTGERTQVSTAKTSLKAAIAQVRTWELQDANGEREQSNVTLAEAVRRWLASKVKLKGGRQSYEIAAAHWTAFLGEKTTVRSIRAQDLEAYFSDRMVEAAGGTLNKERTLIRSLFRYCRRRGWINKDAEKDPASEIAKFTQEKRDIRVLSAEEEELLLTACRGEQQLELEARRNAGGPQGGKVRSVRSKWKQRCPPVAPWLHPLVFLSLRTGLRQGTLAQLEWSWIHLRERIIRVPAEAMKSENGVAIPLADDVLAMLQAMKKKAQEGKVIPQKVLPLPERGNVRRAFNHAIRRAGISHVRLHDLRASFVTQCARAGIDVKITADLVGHRDAAVTLKYYREIDETDKRDAVDKLMKMRATGPVKVRAETSESAS